MRAAARALRADYGGAHDVEAFDEEEVLVLIPSKAESRGEEDDALWAGVRRRACHTVPAMCAYIVVLVVVCALRSASASTASVHTSGGTLEGNSVSRSSVAVPDTNSSKMVLAAAMSVVGLGADCCASVRYAPAGGSSSLPPLWTPKACGADPTIRVSRLRPATTYASGQEKGDSTFLQRGCFRSNAREESIQALSSPREMIARPKISQNEWKTTEIQASKAGNFSPFSCPGLWSPATAP